MQSETRRWWCPGSKESRLHCKGDWMARAHLQGSEKVTPPYYLHCSDRLLTDLLIVYDTVYVCVYVYTGCQEE